MFEVIKQKNISDIIMDQIKEMVYDGRLKVGDKLPSELELANKIGVSRASIREALKALKEMGLIDSKVGGGSFISNNFIDSLSGPLSLMVALNNTDIKSIFEFRKVIEIGAISSATNNYTNQELTELKEILDKMKLALEEQVLGKLDREFHEKIVDMSKNIFFKINMKAIVDILDRFLHVSATKSKKEDILKIHTEIYEALKLKDEKLAKKILERHLEEVEKLNFDRRS